MPIHPIDGLLADTGTGIRRITPDDLLFGRRLTVALVMLGRPSICVAAFLHLDNDGLHLGTVRQLDRPLSWVGESDNGLVEPHVLGIEPCACHPRPQGLELWNPLTVALHWKPGSRYIADPLGVSIMAVIADEHDRFCPSGLQMLKYRMTGGAPMEPLPSLDIEI